MLTGTVESPIPPDAAPAANPKLQKLRTTCLDKLGLWRITTLNNTTTLTFNRTRATWYLLEWIMLSTLFVVLFAAVFSLLIWFDHVDTAHLWTPKLTAFVWLSGIFIFLFGILGRGWDIFTAWRRGPYLRIDPTTSTLELPQFNLLIPVQRTQWTILYSERAGQGAPSAQLLLTLFLEAGQRCGITITSRLGPPGLRELDRMGETLANACHIPLTHIGYSRDSSPIPSSRPARLRKWISRANWRIGMFAVLMIAAVTVPSASLRYGNAIIYTLFCVAMLTMIMLPAKNPSGQKSARTGWDWIAILAFSSLAFWWLIQAWFLPPLVHFDYRLTIPLVLVAYLAVFRAQKQHHEKRRWAVEGLCTNCGYDLRHTPDRCPECGTTPETKVQCPKCALAFYPSLLKCPMCTTPLPTPTSP